MNPLDQQQAWARDTYGPMIGRSAEEVPTPALLLDIDAAERNIERMASALHNLPADIRPHIKVHKSAELAQRQIAAGAIGLSTATVWEAVAMAWAGLDDLFVVNTVSHPEKVRVLAALARHRRVMLAVDNVDNAAALSAAATSAGSRLGVLIEVDTGMDRAGVDNEEQATALAKEILSLKNLDFYGLTGYEGHCSLEPDEHLRTQKHRTAMDMFLGVADRLEAAGVACPVRSAGGTATWQLTAGRTGITEIQAGSYVVMDNFHRRMVGDFEHALTIATTVISQPAGRVIVDAGNKSVAVMGGPSLVSSDLPALRFDEEHGIFVDRAKVDLRVGSWLELVPGYAPATVNMYDVYHVVREGCVVDVWPVFPRGPGHNGLLAVPELG